MVTPQEQLKTAIDLVLREKTLSKEAVDAVQQILTENEHLKKTDETRKQELIDSRTMITTLTTENTKLKANEESVKARDLAVTEREKKMDLLDLTVKYEQLRANDAKGFIETVFRNTVVRKNVNASVGNPNSKNNEYNSSLSESKQEEVREE